MDPKQQNGREKSSSLTAPGRLERSSNQSFKHSSHTNLTNTTDGMNEECDSEADLLIKVIKFAGLVVQFEFFVRIARLCFVIARSTQRCKF